jgi:hypothetical protein
MIRFTLLVTATLLAGTAFARAQDDDDSKKALMFGLGAGYGYGKAEAEAKESVRQAENMERLRQEANQERKDALREAKEYNDRAAALGNHPVINRPTVVKRPVVQPIPTPTPTVVDYVTSLLTAPSLSSQRFKAESAFSIRAALGKNEHHAQSASHP